MRLLTLLLVFFASGPLSLSQTGHEELARRVKPSLVAIYPAGRAGTEAGVGTGFVISEDGLIATNLHVIGEGRPLRVEFPDGNSREVTAVHAWDRARDLAVIRVDGTGLPRLELGDSAAVEQGKPAVVMGNPLGFRYSMVAGMISARQEVEGRTMLQIAMPVERGNSGGPVLDLEGKVLGIVTLKSAVSENLGFAVPVNELKALLEKPNPVSLKNWLTIGALNPEIWQVSASGGAQWTQRAGIIRVQGMGQSFGGRTLCLSKAPVPDLPYDISVKVKLESASGAAGLAFCADGGDVHYGFYPTNGGLRLTRFEGPDVASWHILEQSAPPHYQSGKWNHLRVHVAADLIQCWLNRELIFTTTDRALRAGFAGFCQFRGTQAEFRDFRISKGQEAQSPQLSEVLREAVRTLAGSGEVTAETMRLLQADPAGAEQLADEEAGALEKRAGILRSTAAEAAGRATAAALGRLTGEKDDKDIPLAEAALLIAQLDNAPLDPAPYLMEIDRMADAVRNSLTETDRLSPVATLNALNRWLFEENGFHGSRDEFSHSSNSYLNEVIDDREGLPITLAVLHMELGRKIGLDLVGIPLPGRFVTQLRLPDHSEGGVYIDVFDRGRIMDRAQATAMVVETTGLAPADEAWVPALKMDILLRMLNNLTSGAAETRDLARMLRYLNAGIALQPASAGPRLQRYYLLMSTARQSEAKADALWLLENSPEGTDRGELEALLENGLNSR